ncbi:hypothetical protein EIB75_13175 [Epilithonimonas vandammei]|jgi:hypothetical protein|uniref:Lipoprotein n=1 Tax=Epilithonimonas vandammei TaxID=2487072 RepID=A0A3G8ZQV5_9FLAO|nr:hypothetical protein [Epilithonimonas vandammei]AZI56151.1 hypothetical protein EIB75_13175 [Epilithonimonas vandammei]
MKKLIPFSILVASLCLQSCRQGNELQDDSQGTNANMTEIVNRNDTVNIEHKDPPVKDGQDWIY